jgi:hypothetical protein
MTPEFGQIIARVFRGGADVSLRELVHALNLPIEDVLGSAIEVGRILDAMSLALKPEVIRGDFDARRALVSASELALDDVKELIADEEHGGVEFKSTLMCDLRAYRAEPRRRERSDGVTHSALKTICAFANSSGGRLLIGVEDDLKICGLAPDFDVSGFTRDRWENHLRSVIQTKFWQGRSINSFVAVSYYELENEVIALVDVTGRSESTFLKHVREDRYEFFVRQGNRSVSLDMPEFELHIRS